MGEESLGAIYQLVTVLSFVEKNGPKVCFPVPYDRRVFFLLSINVACVTLGKEIVPAKCPESDVFL